jgi:A/G-specific adenine glycosylase
MNFSRQLLSWYRKNKRDLPWRHTTDPYLIWLSEVIMQQTRIDQGLPYYEKFVKVFPTVAHLAASGEQEILKLWQGLGYYSRARNLHQAAKMIMELHGGNFPSTYASIRSLKGVGDYTAAAIASISFGLSHPVADGNVLRFLARLYGITDPIDQPETKRHILGLASEKIDQRHPGDFNQAMMEFGAKVCTPANPGCTGCVFKTCCAALARQQVATIPFRASKAQVRQRFIHYLVVTFRDRNDTGIFLHQRTGNDIWKNMYDFPQIEKFPGQGDNQPIGETELRMMIPEVRAEFLGVSRPYVHLLTHQRLHVRFYRFHSDTKIKLPFTAILLNELAGFPVPRLIEKYLSEQSILSQVTTENPKNH